MAANGNPVFETVSGDASAATVSPDGGKTSQTLAALTQGQNTLAGSIADVTQDASDAKTVAQSAKDDSASAIDTANAAKQQSQTTSESVANTVPKSMLTANDATKIVSGVNGTVIFGADVLENNADHPEVFPGQGTILGWNDHTTQCASQWININPGSGSGGHRFFEKNTGFNSTNFDVSSYHVAWSYAGRASFGLKSSSASISIGRANSNNWQFLRFFSAPSSYMNGESNEWGVNAGDAVIIARGGDGTGPNATFAIRAAELVADTDGVPNLGSASNRFDNLFLAGTVNQTSDAAEKTVIGTIGDADYTDSAKLVALYDTLAPVVYQYNAAVAAKGAAQARYHVGAIAQAVQAAFTAVGLDASRWSIWSEENLTQSVQIPYQADETTEVIDPKTQEKTSVTRPVTKYKYETQPVLDANGKQQTRQALNYIDLLMLMASCARLKIAAQAAALADLTRRVTALEGKASGSAS